jgi:hypothetical protein
MSLLKKNPLRHTLKGGKVLTFSLVCFFVLPFLATANVTYSRFPSGASVTSPMTFTFSFTDPATDFPGWTTEAYWCMDLTDYETGADYGYGPVSINTQSHAFIATLPPVGSYQWSNVSFYTSATGACDTFDVSGGFITTEGTGGETLIFTQAIGVFFAPESAGGGTISYRPDVTILAPKGPALFSSLATITYEASDQNDLGATEPDSRPFGLSLTPVSLFFSDKILDWDHTLIDKEDKTFIVDKLPSSGSYDWHIKGLSPGSLYRIIVDAIDKVGELGETVSDFFTIDLTPPTFLLSIDPPVVRLESVHISVDVSEDLKEPPRVMVTQRGGKTVSVLMTGAIEAAVTGAIATSSAEQAATATTTPDIVTPKQSARHFDGVYEILSGFDGTAFIAVSGVDRAGNIGTTILSGSSFNVGVEPPPTPPPTPQVLSPLNKASFSSDEIVVKGTSREDTDILLSVNGTPIATVKPGSDGAFVFERVMLNKMLPHGENILSVAARDQAGNTGEAVTLHVSVNGSPTVFIEAPLADALLSGTSTILRAKVSDLNNDPVVLKYEIRPLSPPSGSTGAEDWTALGETLSGKLSFDTTLFPDGAYVLRAIASDSVTTTISALRNLSIKNQLPLIKFSDGRRTLSRGGEVMLSGTAIAPFLSPRPTIVKLEYSGNGIEWTPVPARDGAYDGTEERFAVTFTKRTEGIREIIWRATDSNGRSVMVKHSLVVDTTAPEAPTFLSFQQNAVVSSASDEDRKNDGLQMTLFGKAEARSEVTLYIAGQTYHAEASFDGNWRQTIDLKSSGVYIMRIAATDAAGNMSGTRTMRFTFNNAPEVVFIHPREGRGLHGIAQVDWFAKDPDGDTILHTVLSYRQGNTPFVLLAKDPKDSSFAWDTKKLSVGGAYALRLEVSDGFATTSIILPIAIDNDPPVLSPLIVPRKTFGKNGILHVTGVVDDGLSGIEFVEYALTKEGEAVSSNIWFQAKITGGFLDKHSSYALDLPLDLPDGTYHLLVQAVDAAGNRSSVKEETLSIDSTSPVFGSLELLYRQGPLFPEQGYFVVPVAVPLTLALALEGDATTANVLIDGLSSPLKREDASGLWTTELSFTRVGTTTIDLSATDLSGNIGGKKSVATISVVSPGSIMHEEEGNILPLEEKSIEVFVADSSGRVFSKWNTESSSYGAPIDLGGGKYVLALPRGSYRLVISSDGSSTFTSDTLTLPEAQFVIQDVVLVKKQSFWGTMKAWLREIFHLKT